MGVGRRAHLRHERRRPRTGGPAGASPCPLTAGSRHEGEQADPGALERPVGPAGPASSAPGVSPCTQIDDAASRDRRPVDGGHLVVHDDAHRTSGHLHRIGEHRPGHGAGDEPPVGLVGAVGEGLGGDRALRPTRPPRPRPIRAGASRTRSPASRGARRRRPGHIPRRLPSGDRAHRGASRSGPWSRTPEPGRRARPPGDRTSSVTCAGAMSMGRRPKPSRSGYEGWAPTTTPRRAAASTVRRIVAGSPACTPQATLALVTRSRRASSPKDPSSPTAPAPSPDIRVQIDGEHRRRRRHGPSDQALSAGRPRRAPDRESRRPAPAAP